MPVTRILPAPMAPGYGATFNTAAASGSGVWVFIPTTSTLLVAVICGFSSGTDSYLDSGNYSFSVESKPFTHLSRSPQTNNSFDMAVCYLNNPGITTSGGIEVPFTYSLSSSMTDGYMIYLIAFNNTNTSVPFVSYNIIEASSGTPGEVSGITGTVGEDYLLMATLDSTGAGFTEGTVIETVGPSAKNSGMYLRVRGEVWDSGTSAVYSDNLGSSASLAAISIKYSPGDSLLTPPVTTNNSTFYGPTLTTGPVSITLPLSTSFQVVRAPVVTPGSVGVATPAISGAQTFYSPAVSPGTAYLLPFKNSSYQVLRSPVVSPGAVSLAPPAYTAVQSFPAAALSVGPTYITPDLFTSAPLFFSYVLTPGVVSLQVPLSSSMEVLYAPASERGAVTASPELLVSEQEILTPELMVGDVTLTVTMRETSSSEVFAPLITLGDLSMVVPYTASQEEFYLPAVSVGDVELTPQVLSNAQEFYELEVYIGALILDPPFIEGWTEFFACLVSEGGLPIIVPLFGNASAIYAPSAAAVGAILPEEVSGAVSADLWTSALDQGWSGVLIDEGSLIGTVDQAIWEGTHTSEPWDVFIAPDWSASINN